MLHTKASGVIVLPDGALTKENEAYGPIVSALKGVGLNLAALLCKTLHLLQDRVIAELRACEHHALQVISEQQINNKQMALQRNVAITAEAKETSQSKRIIQVMEEACRMVPELVIPEEELVEVHIRKLATVVRDTQTDMAQV